MTARDMLTRMREHNLHTAPVTTSDGRLVGLVRRRDLVQAVEPERQRSSPKPS
jgi:CBS domain-containing protein